MVAAGSLASGLSAPTLLDGAPPAFSSTARASLPAIAGRQAKKFCPKLDTVLKNPDIYWPGMQGKCPRLAAAGSKYSPWLAWGLQQLNWGAWKNILAQYMSGFLKMVRMSTLAPWHFSQKIHRIFFSINHRQSVNTQPTHPPCWCLTGRLSTAKPTGHIWPRLTCKEKRHFHSAKGHSLWPSPPPRG